MNLYDFKKNNAFDVCWEIIKQNKLNIRKETIAKKLVQHPYPNTLLAITEVLGQYNIKTISYNIDDIISLESYKGPFIMLVNIKTISYFCIVDSIIGERITWYNPIRRIKENIALSALKKIYGGIVTSYEIEDHIQDSYYSTEKSKYYAKKFIEKIPLLLIVLSISIVLITFIKSLISLYAFLYIFGLGFGSLVCAKLINYEATDYNSLFMEKFCPAGKKTDCSTVLQSSANNILGIQLSTIGLAYFGGTMITLLCSGIANIEYFQVAALINVCALPFIIYSLYYQIVVLKHWCVVCLTVLALLLFLFVISILGNFICLNPCLIIKAIPFVILSLAVLWGSNMYTSICSNHNDYNTLFSSFNNLRYNEKVFKTLLNEYEEIEGIPEEMSINIGNPNASVKLLKVCNPYCNACTESQRVFVRENHKKQGYLFANFIRTIIAKR